VPGLQCANLTVSVLKSQLQMYCGAMFDLDDKTRYKTTNDVHNFNKAEIKRAKLLNACRQFMDTTGDKRGLDQALMLRTLSCSRLRRGRSSGHANVLLGHGVVLRHCPNSGSHRTRGAPVIP
jgi:hypothetical protein